jgi:hypothetical protein
MLAVKNTCFGMQRTLLKEQMLKECILAVKNTA